MAQVVLGLRELPGLVDDLEVDHFLRHKHLALEIVAVGRAAHPVEDRLLGRPGLPQVEDAGLVVVNRIDKAADSEFLQPPGHPRGVLRVQCFCLNKDVLLRVVQGRPVHHDQRHVQLRMLHLHDEEGRRVLRHEADLCPVGVEIVQAEHRRRRNLREAVRRQVRRPQEEHQVPLLVPGQAEHVHPDGHEGSDEHPKDPEARLLQRLLDLRERDDHAEEHDGGEARGVGLSDQHRRVQRHQHPQRHSRVNERHRPPHLREDQQHQQKPQAPEGPDHRSGQPVEGKLPAVADVRLHADDRRDHRFRRHVASAVSPQIIDHQTEKYRDRCFQDALPDAGDGPVLRLVIDGFLIHAAPLLKLRHVPHSSFLTLA